MIVYTIKHPVSAVRDWTSALVVTATILLCAVSLLSAPASSAQVQEAGATATAAPTPVATPDDSVQTLRHERDLAVIERDIAENHSDIVAILIACFAGMLTVFVIVFGLKIERSAKAAATAELQNEREKIKLLLQDAQESVEFIRLARKDIDELMTPVPFGRSPSDERTRESIALLAARALSRPRTERSRDDYRALILDALTRQEWKKLRDRAATFTYLFADEAEERNLIAAHYYHGYALEELDETDRAIEALSEAIQRAEKFAPLDLPIEVRLARALATRGFAYGKAGNWDRAEADYTRIIEQFADREETDFAPLVSVAFSNRGRTRSRLDRKDEALADYQETIRRFRHSTDKEVRQALKNAALNSACILSCRNKVRDSVAMLDEWAEFSDPVDCSALDDTDLDAIRDKPSFIAFRKRYCG